MKLILLNTWGGKIYEPLITFLKENSNIDIFCFQEIFNNGKSTRPIHETGRMDIFEQISKVLPSHKGYFSEYQENEEGISIFYKSSFQIIDKNAKFIIRWKEAMIK